MCCHRLKLKNGIPGKTPAKSYLLILIISLPSLVLAQNPKAVRLEQWMGVVGTNNQERLGTYVLGIKPSANLPYRAAVSRFDTNGNGYTDFFRLQSPVDTIPGLTLCGIHPLVGDFNSDGFQDVAVARQNSGYDTVYIYWGTSTGIDTVSPVKIPAENENDSFLPMCTGDINNDGKEDLILTDPTFGNWRGKAYLFLDPITKSIPDYTILGDSVISYYWWYLGVNCAVADLNNDGFNDLIVRGERGLSSGDTIHYDYLNIYWGTGMNSLPDFAHPTKIRSYSPYYGNANWGLACFDVNGDGVADLVWATEDSAGRWINIHFGGKDFALAPDYRIGSPGSPSFGWTVANAGDMNGHGFNDIAVGCPGSEPIDGLLLVYSGGIKIDSTFDAAIGVVGIHTASRFGASVSSVGDINGDGLSDIIIGSPSYPSLRPYYDTEGFWGIFLGDSAIPTSVRKYPERLPDGFELDQAYPNPFNPATTIRYRLSVVSNVKLKIYDVLGKEVKTLLDQEKQAGQHVIYWDGTDQHGQRVASGVYFYRMAVTTKDSRTFLQSKKVSLIK